MKKLFWLILSFFLTPTWSAPTLPPELILPGKTVITTSKITGRRATVAPKPDVEAITYLNCTATRQPDLTSAPNRTFEINTKAGTAKWIEGKKEYPIRVDDLEYLIGDGESGAVIDRVSSQIDYLEKDGIMHGICKKSQKPAAVI